MNKKEMIQSVFNYLSQFGKPDKRILKAIREIDRKNFIDENKEFAYEDTALPIGKGQTISQPRTVARMISLLKLKKTDKVLEIGAGSGWNAALLGKLTKKVLSLEFVEKLKEKAENKIKEQKIKNVKIKSADFRNLKEKFDKIIFTAGISEYQEKIIEKFSKNNLKENGILICPFQSGSLIIIKKIKGKIKKSYTEEEYVFVPLML